MIIMGSGTFILIILFGLAALIGISDWLISMILPIMVIMIIGEGIGAFLYYRKVKKTTAYDPDFPCARPLPVIISTILLMITTVIFLNKLSGVEVYDLGAFLSMALGMIITGGIMMVAYYGFGMTYIGESLMEIIGILLEIIAIVLLSVI